MPTADAPAVARLKDAGAIVFGKTNLPRWSGDVQSFNDLFGTTNNPWAFDRIPGGSSGGAAAAVAAGFTSFELGTDIGGSVRIPSHCCGVFGLKPSFGVIPGLGYLDHVGGGSTEPDINVFGPIARSADDLELLLSVLAAPVPERAVGWRLELPEPTARSLGDLRIGTWFDDPACYIDNEYRAMLGVVVDQLADAGAHVEDRHPDVEFEAQSNVFMRLIMGAISPSVADADADARSGSHRAWLRAEEERAALRTVWSRWFQQYDVLLCPVMTVPAFEHDQVGEIMDRFVVVNGEKSPMVSVIQWLGLIGVLGLPSAVIPIGRTTSSNLPVGMQIVAPFLHDRRAVRVAQLASEVVGGYEVPPGFE